MSLWHSWKGMRERCRDPNHVGYMYYGGRGIKVCDRWNNSFESFREDMESTYMDGLTLERNDTNGDYTLSNCRWASWDEQFTNRRPSPRTVWVLIDEERVCLKEACKRKGLDYITVCDRLKRRWSLDKALNEPTQSKYRNYRYGPGQQGK